MKAIALLFVLASASLPFTAARAEVSDPVKGAQASADASVSTAVGEASARKKVRRHRHVHRSYRSAYSYERPYAQGYYRQGYYRGVRPGWGYGPDPGDRAWPPFHFKPYW